MLNPVGNMTSARSKKTGPMPTELATFFCFCTRMPVRGLLVFCKTSRGKEKEETDRRTGKRKEGDRKRREIGKKQEKRRKKDERKET